MEGGRAYFWLIIKGMQVKEKSSNGAKKGQFVFAKKKQNSNSFVFLIFFFFPQSTKVKNIGILHP